MKIKYIAWKQVISSDVNRLIYGTQGDGLHNRGDQAIQNFNSLNENPGLWSGFTNGAKIPRKKEVERENTKNGTSKPTTFDIILKNSVNPLQLWEDKNDSRKNPIKINHEIWDRNGEHAKRIIEPWYLGYMRILKQILERIVKRDGETSGAKYMLDFVSGRLSKTTEIRTDILQWIYDTQDGFCNMYLDTSFMANANISDLIGFVENYYYLVVRCEDGNETFNMALMANSKSEKLHPQVKQYLTRDKSGGKYVDIDVSTASTSPDAQRFLDALFSRRNIILYGPPGTGKTHMLTELYRSFNAEVIFDDLNTEEPFMITGNEGEAVKEWCTFHPNYSYETFVYGLEPKIINGNELAFKPHIGPMLKLAKKAESGKKALLIIDEINRADTDTVFGNTTAIIDSYIEDTVTLPQAVEESDGSWITDIKSSDNLYIVGTMNSLDKSTSPLSPELKRRFCVVELSPSVEVLRSFLLKNTKVDKIIANYSCEVMEKLNNKIRDFCGKEYELGQGYFWGLVESENEFDSILAEILRNKIIPHLRDILPGDSLSEFFGADNLGILYNASDYGFEMADCTLLSDGEILNSFAKAIGSSTRFNYEDEEKSFDNLSEYEEVKTNHILKQLMLYKNVIITGCTGTGKSYYMTKVLEEGDFSWYSKAHWHGSTEYADVIEGITAIVTDSGLEYSIEPGLVKNLAEAGDGNKLMLIENINKSNAAENFGELITLLEPDKRNLKIHGYDGYISIPDDMYFLCTMTPGFGTKKLDSALKRRFSIIEFSPDYTALALKLNIDDIDEEIELKHDLSSYDAKRIAVLLLKSINSRIKNSIGSDAQIGQAAFWNLPEECSLFDVANFFDDNIIPHLEDYCIDEDIARSLFGNTSPLLIQHNYGYELIKLSKLSGNDVLDAFEEIIKNA